MLLLPPDPAVNPPQNPAPLPMQAAGIFYSPQWITNDPVSPCAAFTFRLAQVLLT